MLSPVMLWLLFGILVVGAAGTLYSMRRKPRLWFVGESNNELSRQVQARAEVLLNLADLKNSFELGKVPEEEYLQQRRALLVEAERLSEICQKLGEASRNAQKRIETILGEVEAASDEESQS